MRPLIFVLVLALDIAPVTAQDVVKQPEPPPIFSTALIEVDQEQPPSLLDRYEAERERKRTRRFWLGVVLIAAGTAITVAAMTSHQKSDLSKEHPDARLGVHLAPCGTKASETRLAIADCKINAPVAGVGLGLIGSGSLLMLSGPLWHQTGPHPQLAFRVRF